MDHALEAKERCSWVRTEVESSDLEEYYRIEEVVGTCPEVPSTVHTCSAVNLQY